jgi:hypothetical protein
MSKGEGAPRGAPTQTQHTAHGHTLSISIPRCGTCLILISPGWTRKTLIIITYHILSIGAFRIFLGWGDVCVQEVHPVGAAACLSCLSDTPEQKGAEGRGSRYESREKAGMRCALRGAATAAGARALPLMLPRRRRRGSRPQRRTAHGILV